MKVLAGLVVLAAVLLLGADRGAHAWAEDRLATEATGQGLETAEATIEGFPFLTQALDRRLTVVRLVGSAYTAPEGRLEDVRVLARGVEVGSGQATAEDLTVETLVPFDVVEEQVEGLALEAAGDGQLTVSTEVAALGETAQVGATGTVEVEGDELVVRPASVQIDGLEGRRGDIAENLQDAADELLGPGTELRLPPPALLEGTRLQGIEVVDGGFLVTLTGTDVPLRR